MTQEISLQNLINQVKKELLAPSNSPDYPLLFVEKVELELAVAVNQGAGGEIGISVLETLSGKMQRNSTQQSSHMIRLTLTPILSRDEIRALLEKDSRIRDRIMQIAPSALLRDDAYLEGTPE